VRVWHSAQPYAAWRRLVLSAPSKSTSAEGRAGKWPSTIVCSWSSVGSSSPTSSPFADPISKASACDCYCYTCYFCYARARGQVRAPASRQPSASSSGGSATAGNAAADTLAQGRQRSAPASTVLVPRPRAPDGRGFFCISVTLLAPSMRPTVDIAFWWTSVGGSRRWRRVGRPRARRGHQAQ